MANRYVASQSLMLNDDSLRRLREIGLLASHVPKQIGLALQPVNKILGDLELRQQRMAASLTAALGPLQQQQGWQKQLVELAPVFERAAALWARLPEGTRRAQDLAADRGWYLSIWDHLPSETFELIALAEGGDADAFEEWIADRTRSSVGSIRRGVVSSFPARAGILDQAFEAHEREHFAVSIPTMLAQADGIHWDLLEQHMFRDNNRKRLKKLLMQKLGQDSDASSSSLAFLFLRPLLQWSALERPTSDRDRRKESDPSFDPLNRHGVLHGIDLDYASELHSLRSIALLDFLQWVKTELSRKAA